jgi:hypothetical protein
MNELIKQQIRDEIIKGEKERNKHVERWTKNKNAYKGVVKSIPNRSNVPIGQEHGYVEAFLAKIDNDLIFKYQPLTTSDKVKAEKRNAYARSISERDNWSKKARANNKIMALYGIQVFHYFTRQPDNILEHYLNVISPENFYMDPDVGSDIEKARFCGHYGVTITREELQSGKYKDVAKILDQDGDTKQGPKNIDNKVHENVFYFYAHFNYVDGEKYYTLYHKETETFVTHEKLESRQGHSEFPYWLVQHFPEVDELYTRSFVDIIRPLTAVQHININLMLDNAMRRVHPEKIVKGDAFQDIRRLQRYTPGGTIVAKQSYRKGDIEFLDAPPVDTPLQIYKNIDGIIQMNIGVTSGDKGLAEEDKVGIYEGNQANSADRYGLFDKNRSDGWKRFAKLFDLSLKNNLTAKDSIKMIGEKGARIEDVTINEMESSIGFDVIVDATLADDMMDVRERREKLEFLSSLVGTEVNQLELNRKRAQLAGLNQDEIRALFDSKAGTGPEVDKANADIDAILNGNEPMVAISYSPYYLTRVQEYLSTDALTLPQKQYEKILAYSMEVMKIAQEGLQIAPPINQELNQQVI